jgi:hypothetical protein
MTLVVTHTGAHRADAMQGDWTASLGGYRSASAIADGGYNGAVGQWNATSAERSAGLTTYIALAVHADGAAHAGVTVGAAGLDVGTAGLAAYDYVAPVADRETAPAGVTFANSLTLPDLANGQTASLWIRRTVAAGADATASEKVSLTIDGTTYVARYRIADDSLDRYELYLAYDDDDMEFSTPAATSASLPLTHTVTPPGSGERWVRVVVRRRNAYDLQSANVYERRLRIDASGDEVNVPDAPVNVSLRAAGGNRLALLGEWHRYESAVDATQWRYYVRTDGVDPDPDVDTPVDVEFNDVLVPIIYSGIILGPHAFATDVRVLLRVATAAGVESRNTMVASALAPEDRPGAPSAGTLHAGDWRLLGRGHTQTEGQPTALLRVARADGTVLAVVDRDGYWVVRAGVEVATESEIAAVGTDAETYVVTSSAPYTWSDPSNNTVSMVAHDGTLLMRGVISNAQTYEFAQYPSGDTELSLNSGEVIAWRLNNAAGDYLAAIDYNGTVWCQYWNASAELADFGVYE